IFTQLYLTRDHHKPGPRQNFVSNVELVEFYSIAHTLSDTPELLVPQIADTKNERNPLAFRTLYGRIAAATRTCFTDICSHNPNPRNFPVDIKAALDNIDFESHATVNFNWDEEVDTYFCKGEDDVAYMRGAWRRRQVRLLLKPHGSINWYDGSEIYH